ncbi:helix-turn-helix transcriptional regulator [Dactylosporangium sp. NPDC005555]|uniref:helix-turn-helix transcriptional regulator n=1 Tax=Dactylosporangium sp. NPDC005555 TaxID=3154889 RepID=UPI0033AEA4B5
MTGPRPAGSAAGSAAAAARWRSVLATAGGGTFDAHTGTLLAAAAAGDPAVLLAAAAAGDPAVLVAAVRRYGLHHLDLDGLNAACRQVRRDQVTERLTELPAAQLRGLRIRALLGPGVPDRLAARLTQGLPGCPGLDATDPLVADVVLAAMDGADRAALRRFAAETAHDKGLPPVLVGRLLSATEPGWPAWALGALLAAAASAATERSWDAATTLYNRALREPMDDTLRLSTWLTLGDVQLTCSPEAAGRTYRTVLRTAPDGGPSPLRLAAADRLLVRGDDEAARRELAATHHDVAASSGEAAALAALYWLAVDRAGTAPELTSDRVPAPDGAATDPAGRGVLAWREAVAGDDVDRARRHALAALDPPAGAVVPPAVQVAAARALTFTEDFDAAERRLNGLVEASRGAGGHAAGPLAARIELWLRTGRLAEAERDLHDLGRCLPEQSWHASTLPRLRALQLMQLLATGRGKQARAALAAPLPPGSDQGIAWAYLLYARAVAEATDGQVDAAVRMLHECGRRCLAAGHRNPALLPWRSQAALWEHVRGRDAEAASLLRAERLAAERWGASGTVALTELRASLLQGDGVTRADRAVVALWAAMRGGWSAETLLSLESAAAGRPRSPAAAAALRAAARIGPGNGWSVRVGGAGAAKAGRSAKGVAVHRNTGRVADRHPETGGDASTLSAAQLRVAELAANGLPNTAIAGILAITKRTVELHLSNAYRKLGITSRSELSDVLGGAAGEHSAVC